MGVSLASHAFLSAVVQAQSGETDVRAEVKMQAAVTTAEHAHTKPRPEKVRTPAFDDAGCHGY